MTTVKIIQLCEATIFCTKEADFWATFWTKDRSGTDQAARPIACCDEHRRLCEEQAMARRVSVSFAPVEGTVHPLRVVKEG